MRFAVTELDLPGVLLIQPRRLSDARGYFMETYRASEFAELGIDVRFVQDNLAMSRAAGTIRGLHFQRPPHAQAKLVRVVRGAVFDVAVDLRAGSATYGRAVAVRLEADGAQLFVPRGFAHGYCTLEGESEVAYRCDAYYAGDAEGGLNAADPTLGIAWPVDPSEAAMSDRDRGLPLLADLVTPFSAEMA